MLPEFSSLGPARPRRPVSDMYEVVRPSAISHARPDPVRAAHALVEALVTAGVDTFFGVPGGPAAPIFQALDEVQGARLIESRQESAAAFAAAGYHRATGRVPAVVVTAGPGATQVVTGVVDACLARVPMIVIAADVAWAANGARLLQDSGPEGIAIEEMLASSTVAQIRIARPESSASQALAALDAALDPERPGPALVVLPVQHGGASIHPMRMARRRRRERSFDVDAEAVRDACESLAGARRPLLVLGAGCRAHADAVRRLVDAIDVPFVTTPAGKGVVREDHPRSLRHGGLAASRWARAYTAEGVDACVVLGTDLDDVSVGPTPYVGPGGTLVHVDLDARVFQRSLPTTLGVVADVEAFADAMRLWWQAHGMVHGGTTQVLRHLKASTAPYDALPDDGPLIAPHRAVLELEAALPDAIYCSDIGEHMLFALHYLTARRPDAFHIRLSLGSMGSGIATSIGVAIGSPHRRVVCIAGDGCMQMMGSEVMVAVKERLPIVFAVFNDARYNMVHHGMSQLYGRARPWESVQIDFAKWGEAFGIPSMRIDRPGQIDAARIATAMGDVGPVLLDIRIDREVRLKGAGRVEALQQMSAPGSSGGSR